MAQTRVRLQVNGEEHDVEGPIHHPTGRHSGPVDLPDSPGSAAEAAKPLQEARPASTI